MSFRLLNIGCCEEGKKGMINIDNGSYHTTIQDLIDSYRTYDSTRKETPLLVICDAEHLPFKDNSFDHIHSDYCMGMYVTDFDDVIRVCKNKCAFTVSVYIKGIGNLVQGLLERGVALSYVLRNRYDPNEAAISGKLFKGSIDEGFSGE